MSQTKKTLSHVDSSGKVKMVDVGDKNETKRVAIAEGDISIQPSALQMVCESQYKKGDVIAVAKVAAIMGAKKTSALIPLCHHINLSKIDVDFAIDQDKSKITCRATAYAYDKTGVEMEALIAVQIGLSTIYDMCKAVDRGMEIGRVRLISKSGGYSGDFVAK